MNFKKTMKAIDETSNITILNSIILEAENSSMAEKDIVIGFARASIKYHNMNCDQSTNSSELQKLSEELSAYRSMMKNI
ncbi:MAG: hypothetical protein ACOYEB_00550 [Enterococcus lemanii]